MGLYLIMSRPSDIGSYRAGRLKMERFTEYSKPRWRKVSTSAIHCVGGGGLGIMTAMVAARLWGFSFWQEFWFDYAVGYAFGWFIFQTWAVLPRRARRDVMDLRAGLGDPLAQRIRDHLRAVANREEWLDGSGAAREPCRA